jgi:hypothetical protein
VLAERVAAGVRALRDHRPAQAVIELGAVAADPELAAAPDLRDVRARVLALYAQALLESGRPTEAEPVVRDAIRLVRRLGDRAGLDEVRGLQDRIVKALVEASDQARRLEEQARIAATPLEALLADAPDDRARAEALVKKAVALADVGDPSGGALAREALAAATRAADVTWQVFARVALARHEPHDAAHHLHEAARAADEADEFNLISVVVEACRALGVALPTHPGAHGEG